MFEAFQVRRQRLEELLGKTKTPGAVLSKGVMGTEDYGAGGCEDRDTEYIAWMDQESIQRSHSDDCVADGAAPRVEDGAQRRTPGMDQTMAFAECSNANTAPPFLACPRTRPAPHNHGGRQLLTPVADNKQPAV